MTDTTVHLSADGRFAHIVATQGGNAEPEVPQVPASSPPGDAPATLLPGDDDPVSFQAHIKPLFGERDRRSMAFAFDLWSYDDVCARAARILRRLDDGTMPCDGAWPKAQIRVFRRWMETGRRP